jgi:FkbM family methyltransferase
MSRRAVLLKTHTLSLLRRVVAQGGFDLVKHDPELIPELRRPYLLRERSIDVLVDVGANDGTFSRQARASGFSGRIAAFEPAAEPFAALARAAQDDPLLDAWQLALASSEGEAVLNISANTSSSSLLELGPRHLLAAPESRYLGEQAVRTARLDDILERVIGDRSRVYLKLDVQGAELDVLAGAEELLRIAEVVDCELSLAPLYVDGARWTDVVEYLDARGFGLLWLDPVLRDPATNELLQMDGLFVRTGS